MTRDRKLAIGSEVGYRTSLQVKAEATAYGRGFFFGIALYSGPGALPPEN
jgi:hypothetical protein